MNEWGESPLSKAAAVVLFHNHLDKCKQCEQNPHDLCAIGAQLLMATAGFGSRLKPEEEKRDDDDEYGQ